MAVDDYLETLRLQFILAVAVAALPLLVLSVLRHSLRPIVGGIIGGVGTYGAAWLLCLLLEFPFFWLSQFAPKFYLFGAYYPAFLWLPEGAALVGLLAGGSWGEYRPRRPRVVRPTRLEPPVA